MTVARAMPSMTSEIIKRFFSHVIKGSACWIWKGEHKPKGYGRFRIGKARYAAHRVSFFIHNGYINRILEIDHTCHVRDCVNPAHLEQVTKLENQKRKKKMLRTKDICNCAQSLHYREAMEKVIRMLGGGTHGLARNTLIAALDHPEAL